MSRTLAWVVGRGGFLGGHVARAVASEPDLELWEGPSPLPWSDSAALLAELERALDAFFAAARERRFAIVWCAGAGVIGAAPAALAAETATFGAFLERLAPRVERHGAGAFFLAGSAGGVYGGSAERPLTESTPCRPISDYGREKLRQEELLLAWAEKHPRLSVLVGRISNLYGPGQNLAKPQGIMSHLARSFIYRRPIHLWVGLDNVRDYIYVEDCARKVARAASWLAALEQPVRRVKIIASEQEASLASVIGIFRRVARHSPRVICVRKEVGAQQPAELSFRSRVEPRLPAAETPLPVGVHRVFQDLLALYGAGRLAPPA